ncbi:hypothetical protein [Sulfurovum sp.]|uniref:hypothetical protein n=1 Tax=Sulfurovum sp. TaxID=1969726 RepID=UPI003562B607
MALELSKNRTVNIVVFSSIIGVVISIVALWYSTDQKSRINGASLLATSEKLGVVFSMDQSFYHTDADARVINIVTYEQLGLQKPLADIAFSEDALYVIEAGKHVVKKCTVPLGKCQEIGTIPGSRSAIAMDIAVMPDNKHFYISNSSLHRIDKFTIDGTHLYRLDIGESLNYPNDIVAINNTTIAVADSVNNRVIAINDKGSDASKVIWQLDVDTGRRLDWPSALSFSPNGRLWVNNQDLYFDVGEVVVYDAVNFSFLNSKNNILSEKVYVDYTSEIIQLNNGAEPRNFAPIKDSMLVGNFNPIELLAMDQLSLGVRSFVNGELQNEFTSLSDNRQYWLGVETTSKLGIGLFVILLLYGAFLEMKEVQKRKDEEEPKRERRREQSMKLDRYLIEPDENGIVWLEMKSKSMKQLKLGVYAIVILSLLASGLLVFSGEDDLFLYQVTAGMVTFSVLLAAFFHLMIKRTRMGRDEEHIYLQNWLGKQALAPFEDVIFTGRRVIINNVAVAILDGHGNEMFDKKEFKTYIKPLINVMQEKSEWKLVMDNLKKGDQKTWTGAIVGILIMLAIVYWSIKYQ